MVSTCVGVVVGGGCVAAIDVVIVVWCCIGIGSGVCC